ncbi:polyphosphate kinase 2 family protein [Roseimaritima ulvae]|uniref:Polyphosphate kinase 2 (PPK2) n=1 Tax=Roseimaritima ulvae TaxID=980254 RepID=A0A5B9QTM9_9BACT|nr:polyphosphate kinase 2 family protein [Roseimaritima ulvae]QEG42374.1 Polyphosphate kinase 2 (PPK2) [Roseimaritima ulvae]
MDFYQQHIVDPDKRVRLKEIDSKIMGPFADKQEGYDFTADAVAQIQELQYRMFTESKQSLLIVLQAPDAAGKDGLIRKVLGQMNPQGCRTYPFKAPSRIERAHDFLWRIHQCTPATGMVSIFNRSHYEDVLVVRVEDLVPKSVWSQRYEIINQFEKLLAERGTRILKFYLHISLEEQLERFRERLERPEKHWKLNPADYEARDNWEAYHEAYEDVFARCSTPEAPWFIIPADRKWYRNAAVASIVLETLKRMDPQFPEVEVDLDEMRTLYERAAAR